MIKRWTMLSAVALTLGGLAGVAAGEDLSAELKKLDALRQGRRTPLSDVEQQGGDLLKKHPEPKDQGQIYYEIAHIFAQSGQVRPEKTIEYAKKAFEYPLELGQRLRLYVYWGDALQLANPKEPFAARRRAAVMPYLDGLHEILKLDLPDKAPELPRLPPAVGVAGPDAKAQMAEAERKRAPALAAFRQAQLQREMVMHRDVLILQIAQMYGRQPFANEEVESLTKEKIDDPAAVDRLMDAVKARVARTEQIARQRYAKAQSPEVAPAPASPSPLCKYLAIINLAALLVLGLAVLRLVARKRARRAPAGG